MEEGGSHESRPNRAAKRGKTVPKAASEPSQTAPTTHETASKAPHKGEKHEQLSPEEVKAHASRLRSRIIGHADVSPRELKAHAMNFRKHPDSQMKALRGSMEELGWIKTVLVSQRTGTIIDGHARVEEALRQKLVSIPVTYLDLSEEEERKALAMLDPITEMATKDTAMFQKVLDSFESQNSELFKQAMEKMAPLKDEALAELQTSTKIVSYDPNVFFPSTNHWQIPDLREDMLYDGDAPTTTWPAEDDEGHPQFYIWGSGGIDQRVSGKILCFYTDDYRFENIWNECVATIEQVVPLKPLAAVAPDFSLWSDTPLIVQVWQVYRARWISRFWQEAGVRIIPSLATSTNPHCYDFAFLGFPKRPSLMAMQMRAGGVKTKQHHEANVRDVATLIERVNPMRLVIYGASNRSKMESSLPGGVEYIWSQSFTEARTLQGAFKRKVLKQ